LITQWNVCSVISSATMDLYLQETAIKVKDMKSSKQCMQSMCTP